MIKIFPPYIRGAVIIRYNCSIDESRLVPGSVSPLIIPASQVLNSWGTSGCTLFTMSTQCKTWDYALHWLLNVCMCHVLISSILTRAVTLILITNMCWTRVTLIVLYSGASTRDYGAVSNLEYSVIRDHMSSTRTCTDTVVGAPEPL
jgi:hypothetical protein